MELKTPYISALGQEWNRFRQTLIWRLEVMNVAPVEPLVYHFGTIPAQAPEKVVDRVVSDSESDTHLCLCKTGDDTYTALLHQGSWYVQDQLLTLFGGF